MTLIRQRKSKRQLFKFQKPLFSIGHERDVGVLVYNENRSIMGEIPMTANLQGLFEEHGPKFYAHGYQDTDGKVILEWVDTNHPNW